MNCTSSVTAICNYYGAKRRIITSSFLPLRIVLVPTDAVNTSGGSGPVSQDARLLLSCYRIIITWPISVDLMTALQLFQRHSLDACPSITGASYSLLHLCVLPGRWGTAFFDLQQHGIVL